MGKIVLLDDLTINQIAAGEVIERPMNVVKELVENSLDANSKNIIIEIKNGGKTFIKVTDDGTGIEKDDMVFTVERHATSKIRSVDDLENTYSMGFRGEALASISSISELTITSKTSNVQTGTRIFSKAGKILQEEEVGCPKGTNILVEKIFFNTPVRYKFLKKDATEYRYIKEWIEKTAIANLDVSFKLINDGKQVFCSNGDGNLLNTIYKIFGKHIKENLVSVNYNKDNIKITGVVGNTTIARDTRKDQILFLNKRNIKNKIIINSADQAFKGSTGIGKYGFYILNMEMPANYYDVNVHPTKLEVRFKNENQVYKSVYHAIKESLLNSNFLGNDEKNDKEKYVENEVDFLTNHNEDIDNLKLIERSKERKINYKIIGISFKTYIITEIDNEIFLIDQHAAHERILYEKIKSNYKNNINANTQMKLIPEVVTLKNKEMEFINTNKELIKRVGFEIEDFGERAIKICGVPDLEYRSKSKNIFLDIVDEMMVNERTSIKDIEERFIATVACKAAVKAGMVLTLQEADNLIKELLKLNNPYTCPHGRPTTIKIMSLKKENKI